MTRLHRPSLKWTGIIAATLLAVICGAVFIVVARYEASINGVVSQSLGTDFTMRGRASVRLFPRPGLRLRDIHLSKGTTEILSAEALDVSPHWISLLLH